MSALYIKTANSAETDRAKLFDTLVRLSGS